MSAPDYGEPWVATDKGVRNRHGEYPLKRKSDHDRMCACVSACAGMVDPAAEISDRLYELQHIRADNERLTAALKLAEGRP